MSAPRSGPLQVATKSPLFPSNSGPVVLWAGGVLLAVALLVAYSATFHAPFLPDDTDAITNNPTIRSLSTAWFPPMGSGLTVSGRPVLNVSLAVNYRYGAMDPFDYHVANLAIHLLAAFTLWGVIRRTLLQPGLSAKYAESATGLAWAIACLWALHPLQTESVTYVVQRAESLAGLFYLLTLYAFIRHVQSPGNGWMFLAWLACCLGLATKETVVTAPVVVLLYDRTFVSGSFRESWRRHGRLHGALLATWALLILLLAASGGRGESVDFVTVTWWNYLATQTTAVVRYLGLALWPVRLVFDYGVTPETRLAWLIPCGLGVGLLTAGTLLALKRWPVVGFFGGCFFVILAPSSSVVPVVTQIMAEHRMYLPLVVPVAAGVLLLHRWNSRYSSIVMVLLIVLAGTATFRRNAVYESCISLWRDTVEKMPENARALNNLGAALFNAGQPKEAVEYLSKAVEIFPHYADAHLNLGLALLETGRRPEGLGQVEEAVRLRPDLAIYHEVLGQIRYKARQLTEAAAEFTQAVALAPTREDYRLNLAGTLVVLDRKEQAIIEYESLLRMAPPTAQVLNDLGVLYARTGRIDEAEAVLHRALEINPNDQSAQRNLALIAAYRSGRAKP